MIFLLLLSALIFTRRITTFPLRNWDEAWYAEASKNMASGTWGHFMQFWNGRYYFDHAPLYFWLSAPIFKIFGAGEWQARLVSTIAAIICVCVLFLIGRKLFGLYTGFFSVLSFLTFGGVVMRFSHGNLDSLLICLFLTTFYFFLKSYEGKTWLYLSGVTFGLGLLVKSWGIGLFPMALICTYLVFQNKKHYSKVFVILVVGLLVSGWWYIAGFLKFGSQFINWYLLNPSEGRLGTPLENFSLKYFTFAMRDFGAWSLVIIFCGLLILIKKIRIDRNVFALIAVSLIYIICLNFLSDKSDWYLIPAYPLIALVIGYALGLFFKFNHKLTVIAFIALVCAAWWNSIRIENIYPDRSMVGAKLGVETKKIIPFDDEVILDDHDFTAFLYYSGQNHIYTLQNNRKDGEWWIIKDNELGEFLKKNKRTWIVTAHPESLQADLKREEVFRFDDYVFLKFYSD